MKNSTKKTVSQSTWSRRRTPLIAAGTQRNAMQGDGLRDARPAEAAAYRAQADALDIEAQAKRRLADEYDAAQERGEIARSGDTLRKGTGVPKENSGKLTASDVGLSPQEIYEAVRSGMPKSATPASFDEPSTGLHWHRRSPGQCRYPVVPTKQRFPIACPIRCL